MADTLESLAYEELSRLTAYLSRRKSSTKEIPDALLPPNLKKKIEAFKKYYGVESDWTYKATYDMEGSFNALYSPCVGNINDVPHIVWGNTIKPLGNEEKDLRVVPAGSGYYCHLSKKNCQVLDTLGLDPADFYLSLLIEKTDLPIGESQWKNTVTSKGLLHKFLRTVVSSIANLEDGEHKVEDFVPLDKGGKVKIGIRWYRVNASTITNLQSVNAEDRIIIVDGKRTWKKMVLTNYYVKGKEFVTSLTKFIEECFIQMGQPLPAWEDTPTFAPPLFFEILDCFPVNNKYTSHALKIRHPESGHTAAISPNSKLKRMISNGAFDLDTFEDVEMIVTGADLWQTKPVINLSVNVPINDQELEENYEQILEIFSNFFHDEMEQSSAGVEAYNKLTGIDEEFAIDKEEIEEQFERMKAHNLKALNRDLPF